MKDLIKQQEEEFDERFLKIFPDGSRRFLRNLWIEDFEAFISKVRKESYEAGRGSIVMDSNGFIQEAMLPEDAFNHIRRETAEYVCDEMIGRKLDENCKYDMGYNFRIELEKEIKQNILKEFNNKYMENEQKECDYCNNEAEKLVDTPYMADIGNKMCKKCWELLDEETVGTFENPTW